MKYVGSKNRIAKEILKIMLPYRKENTYWVEPFVGGGNLIDKVDGFRIGSDKNKNVIDALLSIKNHIDDLPKNNLEFWDWVEYISISNKYSKVFVSEYNAPKKFECLYSKEIASSLTKHTGSKKAIEKLFTFSG